MTARSEYRGRMKDLVADLRAKADQRNPEAAACFSDGLSVTNMGDQSVLRIYEEISQYGITAGDVIDALDQVTGSSLRVELNSPGGSVFDGITIHNALRSHPAHITVRVDGIAASIASVIVQAGDVRIMQPGAQMMVHNAFGVAIGNKSDHADMAALLELQDGVIADIYASRSGRDAGEFRALMDAETWLTDQAAVDAGLADAVAKFEPKLVAKATTVVEAVVPEPTAEPTSAPPFSLIAANANRRRR